MSFNHYAKIKRILETYPDDWYIKRIDKDTSVKNFKGELIQFSHYYRIFDNKNEPIKYCKFQQIERLAKILNIPVEDLPTVN